MNRVLLLKNTYHDSVFLMSLSRSVKALSGVQEAMVAMATEMNLGLLRDTGLWEAPLESAGPNDLVLAVKAESDAAIDAAFDAARRFLGRKSPQEGGAFPGESRANGAAELRPVSLETAAGILPGANIAVISVPGLYAAREARKALKAGLHVMLFSDNVSVEDEVSLKILAREKGLLMMGPDCGTAIINGKPLCFANRVRRGDIGFVAASGTGLQETVCLVHRSGGGVSQAIGTGGRDLKNGRIGGLATLGAITALSADPQTRVIVVVSKPPSPEAAEKVVCLLEETGKACVVHFIGMKRPTPESAAALGFCREPGSRPGFSPEVLYATNLEEAAGMAVALSRGVMYVPRTFTLPETDIARIVQREAAGMSSGQKYLRGLFTGGTLADEALILLHDSLGGVRSNNSGDPAFTLKDPRRSVGHTIVDLGDDIFTVGRPHPMIDPEARAERILQEAGDPETAVLLLDLVLGCGSHPDPAGAILPALRAAKDKAASRGGYLSAVASVTGTEDDPQNPEEQKRRLEDAGCLMMPSNYQAALLARLILEKAANR